MRGILIAAVILLVGCAPAGTITVGGLFALTGGGSSWGSEEMKAVKLAIAEANTNGGVDGKELELIVEDFETDNTKAVTSLNKLHNANNINIILGPTWAEASKAVAPILQREEILAISPSCCSIKETGINSSYFFTTWASDRFEVKDLLRYVQNVTADAFAVIYSPQTYSSSMKRYFVEESSTFGINVTTIISQDASDKDYRTALLKAKRAGAEAVYAPLPSADERIGLLMKQQRELGLNLSVYTVAIGESQALLEQYGEAVDGLRFAVPEETEQYARFEKRYEERYGESPTSPAAATAYDAAKILVRALRRGHTRPDELRDHLPSMPQFEGASNTIEFDKHGDVKTREYVIKQVVNRSYQNVADP